jgi:hypothetical protein
MHRIGYLMFWAAFVIAAAFLGPSYLALSFGVVIAAAAFAFAARFLRADRSEARKSQARSPNFLATLRGKARTSDDWLPDARVQGGLTFNRKENRIEISGRLSDDSVDRVFR